MKNVKLLVVMLFVVFVFGCSDDESNPVGPETSSTITSLQGKINNWILGSSKLIKFNVFGSSSVDETGNFTIANLSVPYEDQMKNILNYYSGFTQQPVLSDENVKYFIVPYLSIVNASEPGRSIGSVQKVGTNNPNLTVGDYFTNYFYLDKPIVIDGVSAYSIGGVNYKEVYNNVTLVKGWNRFVNIVYAIDATTNTITYEIATIEPTEGLWYYFSNSNSSLSKFRLLYNQ